MSAGLSNGEVKEVISPLEGKFYLTRDSSETPLKVGNEVKTGEVIGYIESMKTYNAVSAEESGKVIEICFSNGDSLAPHLLGPIAIAAYSYMALVPVIIPLVANLLMTNAVRQPCEGNRSQYKPARGCGLRDP